MESVESQTEEEEEEEELDTIQYSHLQQKWTNKANETTNDANFIEVECIHRQLTIGCIIIHCIYYCMCVCVCVCVYTCVCVCVYKL